MNEGVLSVQKTISEEELQKLKVYIGKEVSVHLCAAWTCWDYGEPASGDDEFFCSVQLVDVVKDAVTWDKIGECSKEGKRLVVPFYYEHGLPWEDLRRYIKEIKYGNEIIYHC